MEYRLVPYAKALYKVADAAGKTSDWLKILQSLASQLSESICSEFLSNPTLTMQKKSSLLCSWMLSSGYPKELAKFIELLVLNGKIGYLPEVCGLMQAFDDKSRNIYRVEVVQAMELSEPYKQKILTWLEKKLLGTVIISWQLDPELIGGFLVNVGDIVYDYSIRVRLTKLRKIILGK